METHIDGTMYGDSYRGYSEWRLIQGYNVRRLIERVQCMDAHLEGTM